MHIGLKCRAYAIQKQLQNLGEKHLPVYKYQVQLFLRQIAFYCYVTSIIHIST